MNAFAMRLFSLVRDFLNSTMLLKSCLRTNLPLISTSRPFSYLSLHLPVISKFSSAKPSGSILEWQPAQSGFSLCFEGFSDR